MEVLLVSSLILAMFVVSAPGCLAECFPATFLAFASVVSHYSLVDGGTSRLVVLVTAWVVDGIWTNDPGISWQMGHDAFNERHTLWCSGLKTQI